jgi:FKBP-type peptidyl-prolyl cis-trans isomerase FkpA
MKRKLMFLALAAVGLASCNGGFKKGDAGLLYNIVEDKAGPSIQPGDFIAVNFIIKNDADSVLASSYETGNVAPQIIQKSPNKGDVISGLFMLSEGDSAIFKTNIDSLTKGAPRQAGLKGKYMVYVIKVEKVIAKGNLSEDVFKGRYMAYLKTLADAAKKQEPVKIKKYIADNNLKVTQTASGLNYQITKESTGPKPVIGDTVVVYYVGKFLNGKIFDTNIKAEAVKGKVPFNPMDPGKFKPAHMAVGTQTLISGWNEALQLMNKGSKATLVLPSSLAYGEQGYQSIQPFTPLEFEIELLDIIKPNPNAPKPVTTVPPAQQPITRKK